MSKVDTNWQLLISVTTNVTLVLLRELLSAHDIEYVEMNRSDSAYPWAFSDVDIYVSSIQLIDAKLLLIENQIE